jgi:peptidoglycan/LPS O-acetylase OafA/YrhL
MHELLGNWSSGLQLATIERRNREPMRTHAVTVDAPGAPKNRGGRGVRSDDRLPSLDGFRAISIMMVLIAHIAYSLKSPHGYYFGDLGVRCFFVISGFLITHLLLKEEKQTGQISLRLFYARRFVRIVPVYLVFIACLFLLDATTSLHLPLCNFVTSLTYTKDFGGCGQWIDGHLWSLSVEEQFYLLWPLVLVGGNSKQRLIVALSLICACPFFRVAYYVSGGGGAFSPFTNADTIMFGCAGALLLSQYHGTIMRALNVWPTVGRLIAVCFIAIPLFIEVNFWIGVMTVPFARTAEAAGFAYLIVSYAFVPTGIGYQLLNLRPMRFIGVISYSLYILAAAVLLASRRIWTDERSAAPFSH